jgi:hypothetical protein
MNKYRIELATDHLEMIENMFIEQGNHGVFNNFTWDAQKIAANRAARAGRLESANRLESAGISPFVNRYWTPERTAATIANALANPNSAEAWKMLSRNPTLDFSFVRQHLDRPWDWAELSKNPTLTINDLIQNHDKAWGRTSLSRNPGITLEDMMSNEYKYGRGKSWNWACVPENPNVKWWHLRDDTSITWDYARLSKNKFNRHPIIRARLEKLAAEEDVLIANTAAELGTVLPDVLVMIVLEYVF